MNILLLRGKEPTDRNPTETYYKDLFDCDDLWTHLVHEMAVQTQCHATVAYWGGGSATVYDKYCDEIRMMDFSEWQAEDGEYDVIIARGGFPEYHQVINQYPKVFKVYYGAGKRFAPIKDSPYYNMILVDSPEQEQILRDCPSKAFKNAIIKLLIKPTVDHMFYQTNANKKYDVCYVANGPQENRKGQEFIFSTAPKDISILHVGFPGTFKPPSQVTSERTLRKHMISFYNKCKIGIIPYEHLIDSCPRVISEMLACGLPIVVLDKGIYINEKLYVNSETGIMTNKDNFWSDVRYVLQNYQTYNTANYYKKHLCLAKSAKQLISDILGRI